MALPPLVGLALAARLENVSENVRQKFSALSIALIDSCSSRPYLSLLPPVQPVR
jgi:hypothetical protein